ncbi:hypothetical protein ACS0TY_007955 [Phlomoides rotata]
MGTCVGQPRLQDDGATTAGILRNDDGVPVWCFTEMLGGMVVVGMVESLAIEKGLNIAVSKRVRDVDVEYDSQLVISTHINLKPDLSYLGSIV